MCDRWLGVDGCVPPCCGEPSGSRWIGVAIIVPLTVVVESSDCVHGCECSPACYAAVTGVASRDVGMPAVIVAWEEPGEGTPQRALPRKPRCPPHPQQGYKTRSSRRSLKSDFDEYIMVIEQIIKSG